MPNRRAPRAAAPPRCRRAAPSRTGRRTRPRRRPLRPRSCARPAWPAPAARGRRRREPPGHRPATFHRSPVRGWPARPLAARWGPPGRADHGGPRFRRRAGRPPGNARTPRRSGTNPDGTGKPSPMSFARFDAFPPALRGSRARSSGTINRDAGERVGGAATRPASIAKEPFMPPRFHPQEEQGDAEGRVHRRSGKQNEQAERQGNRYDERQRQQHADRRVEPVRDEEHEPQAPPCAAAPGGMSSRRLMNELGNSPAMSPARSTSQAGRMPPAATATVPEPRPPGRSPPARRGPRS